MDKCPRCKSLHTFNRHTYMLCLDCGHRFARTKHSLSVTDWQLKCRALESERDRLKGENLILRYAVAQIKALPLEIYADSTLGTADATLKIVESVIAIIKTLGET